jgi:hypothetical protein
MGLWSCLNVTWAEAEAEKQRRTHHIITANNFFMFEFPLGSPPALTGMNLVGYLALSRVRAGTAANRELPQNGLGRPEQQ